MKLWSELMTICHQKGIYFTEKQNREKLIEVIKKLHERKSVLDDLEYVEQCILNNEYDKMRYILDNYYFPVTTRNMAKNIVSKLIKNVSKTMKINHNPKITNKKDFEIIINRGVYTSSIGIGIEDFLQTIKTKEFCTDFVNSLKSLYHSKLILYRNMLDTIKSEKNSIETKMEKLKSRGMNFRDVKDIYPSYENLFSMCIELEEVIKKITEQHNTLTVRKMSVLIQNSIFDSENGINSIVGREDVKKFICSKLYAFSKGGNSLKSFNNIIFYGKSGIGKTKLARVISHIFSSIGIFVKNQPKIATRTDMIGQYVGQTGIKTRYILYSSIESVLFIDEAYEIYKSTANDYGTEAITEMVNFMDKYMGANIIILAGYKDKLSVFMESNEGLERRFPNQFDLSPYTCEELYQILIGKINQTHDLYSQNFDLLNFLIKELYSQYPIVFDKQAGDMLNLSSHIINSIDGSYKNKWDEKNSNAIILDGINMFLASKKMDFYIELKN